MGIMAPFFEMKVRCDVHKLPIGPGATSRPTIKERKYGMLQRKKYLCAIRVQIRIRKELRGEVRVTVQNSLERRFGG